MKRHGGTFGINGNITNKNTWAALALLAAVGFPMAARGQSVDAWDSSGTHPTAPVDGSGNWDLSSALWSNGSRDIVWPDSSNSLADFGNGGVAGTVTLQTPILARGVVFNPVGSGTYTIASAGATDTLSILSVGVNANANISAPIAGGAGLAISGTGTLDLSGANTYTGATVINSGTLQLGAANTLPATTAVTVNGGATFDTNNQTQTIASLGGAGTALVESGSALTLNQSTGSTFSGTLTGSGTINKLLAGALTLTAPETGFTGQWALTATTNNEVLLSGNTNINNSTLNITDTTTTGGGPVIGLSSLATALSAPINFTATAAGDYRMSVNAVAGSTNAMSSNVNIAFPTTTSTAFPSFTMSDAGGSFSVNSTINVNNTAVDGQIVFRGAGVTNFTGLINAPSKVIIATTDAGTLNFAPQTGSTWGTISAGGTYTVAISSDSALAGSTPVAGGSNGMLFSGGRLQLDNYTSNLNFVQANMNTTSALNLGSAAGGTATYNGSISLSGTNAINFVGPGATIFTGSITYTGATVGAITISAPLTLSGSINYTTATSATVTISAGTTQLEKTNALLPPVGGSGGTALTVSAGATFDLNNNYQDLKSLAGAGNILLTGSGSELELDTSTGTFSGAISGAGEFAEVGGTLTLSGNNTNSGVTYIGGTLTAGSATGISSASDVQDFGTLATGAFNPTLGSLSGSGNVTGAGALTVGADNNSQVFGGIISTTSSLTLVGTSTFQLANNNTYTGATNINSGTLQLGTTNALPVGTTVNIAALGTLDLNGNSQQIGALSGSGSIVLNGQLTVGGANANSSFSGSISGGGTLTVSEGAYTLAVTGSNTAFGGSTQVNTGTLAINNDSAINLSQISFTGNGGWLQFMNYASNASFNNVANLALGAATGSVSTLNGAITGSNGLSYFGPGTLILTNTGNNYSGGTNINGGNLQFAAGAFPSGTSITINNGGALNLAGAFTTVTGTLPSINPASTGALALMGDSSENINFTGYNTLALGAAVNSTYTGTITPAGGNYNLGGGGATLTLPNTNALTGGNNLVIGSTGSTGTVALTGNNNFTGTIALNGGTLAISSDAAINNGSITFAGGTLQLNGYSSNLPAFSNSGGAPVIIAAPVGAASTLNSAMPSGAGFTYQGPGTLLLGANVSLSATAPLVVNAGTLDLNGNSQTVGTLSGAGNINTESGTTLTASAAGSTTYSGVISGAGGFTKNATGILSITGANTLTGPVAITQAASASPTTLALSGNGSFNNASSLTLTNTANTGGTNDVGVTLTNLVAPMSVPIVINTPTSGGDYRVAMINLAGNNTVTSPTIMNAGENGTNVSTLTYSSAAGTVLTINSAVTIPSTNGAHSLASIVGSNGPALTVDGELGFRGIGTTAASVVGIFNGSISGAGASTLLIAKTDPGAWLWEPAVGSVWGVTQLGIGTLQMGAANAMAPTSVMEMAGSSSGAAVFDLNGFNQTVAALGSTTADNTVTSSNGPATLTINTGGNTNEPSNFNFGGGTTDVITGPLTIIITGTSSQTFNEPNTYTGGTNLNGGTLVFSALTNLGSGPITFNGGTIQFAGTTNTADLTTNGVTINSGGGTINTLTNTVTFANAVTGAGTLAKTGTGSLTLNSPASLGGLTASAGTLHLVAAGNAITGTLAINGSSTVQLDGNTTAGKLSGDGTGTLKITAGKLAATAQAQSTLSLASLSISAGAVLDIDNGNLAINYGTGADPISTIASEIANGYDNGNWNGVSPVTGSIISSASIGKATALGYADNTTLHQVQVKYTWYGDLDLSGTVNNADLTAMNTGNGSSWSQGDLNYDGVKNADDYSLFMYGDVSQNGSIPAGVPEPSGALLALALPALGLRRRSRCH